MGKLDRRPEPARPEAEAVTRARAAAQRRQAALGATLREMRLVRRRSEARRPPAPPRPG